MAAADVVRKKRLRYAGGRLAEETEAYMHSLGNGSEGHERTQVLRFAWQQYINVLQAGNAEMILSAVG